MDRNASAMAAFTAAGVALRKESVDRNSHAIIILVLKSVSLSVRRAWIEMSMAAVGQAVSAGRSP